MGKKQVETSSLRDYKGCHKNETIIVCGCGESLNELADPDRFITIGVNDVGRLFDPTYLVVLNPEHQFKNNRFSYVRSSRASAVFSQIKLAVNHPDFIQFKLGKRGGTEITDEDVLPYTKNSTYVALCLAMYMGARRIGLIGVDFTDHHFFEKTGKHSLSRHINQINAEYKALNNAANSRGIEIFNLSKNSQINAFKKTTLDEFYAEKIQISKYMVSEKTQSLRVFCVNYKFLSCGQVFTDGLKYAANELGLIYESAEWDDPQLAGKIEKFNADLLFVVHGRKFIQKWRQRIRHKNTAVWLLDEPYEVDDTEKYSNYFDYVFINDPATLSRHRNAHYLPVAYDPSLHKPGDSRRIYQLGFIGGYNKTRENYLLKLLEAGYLSYVVGGPWKDRRLQKICRAHNISAKETADLYRQTQIVVNVFRDIHHFNRKNISAVSLNPRVYEALACGAAVISEYRPELQQIFPQLPVFNNAAELLEQTKKLLDSPGAINDLLHACKDSLSKHSYVQRFRQVLQNCLPKVITDQQISLNKENTQHRRSGVSESIEYAILMVVHNACDMVQMSILKTLKHTDKQNARLIIVDNASNDGVEKWLSILAKRGDIDLISSKQNIGHGPGLELARSQSHSNYIVSLDSDAFPLSDDWLDKLRFRFRGKVKISGICHHRDYIHPSCLMIKRETMDKWDLNFLNEKSMPSRFDVAERMSHEVKRRGYSISRLKRNTAQRRGSVSEPIYLGSGYENLVYHQWYTTRTVLGKNDQVDDVPAGAITDCLQELYQNYHNEPRELTVIVGARAGEQDIQRIRNTIAVINAINLQSLPRWKYRVILVEQDSEPRLQKQLSPLVDRYQFIYNAGAYNRGWAFNVGAILVAKKSGYLCLLDADLLVPTDFLSSALQVLHSGKQALRPFNKVIYLDNHSSERAISERMGYKPGTSQCTGHYQGRAFNNSEGGCIWVSAALYHDIGGHDERFRGWGGEDREFSYRLAKNTEIHTLQATLLHLYHPEPESDACSNNNPKLLQKLRGLKQTKCKQVMGDLFRYTDERIARPCIEKEITTPGFRDWEHWHEWTENKIENIVIKERHTRLAESVRKQLVDHVVSMGSHILDAGCGAGALWPHLKSYQPNVSWVGVDVTEKMLQVAHCLFPDVPVICADAGSLPFSDNSFDVVVLRHVLEHLPPWLLQKSLSEVLRVARNAVIIDFYIPPVNNRQTESVRVAEGFYENSWSTSELNGYIDLLGGRVFQQKVISSKRGQSEAVWFIEPAIALQHQSAGQFLQRDYKVSIIMPTYRRQHTIFHTIDSIKNQNYQNWELIVIDNDGGEDYCFDDSRIRLYHHTEITGSSYARNKGLQYITGDLVCFFDDDDEMYPDYLEKFVKVFQSRPDTKMVCCGMVVSDGSVNYSYATPECCLRRGFATPTWENNGPCQDQRYFRNIVKLRGWSKERGDIVTVKQALCQANTSIQGGLRAGQY